MIYQPSNQKKLAAEINVVPYIDVMLVLLIIFMILSPLLIQGVDVDLPQTDTTKMSIESEPMVISINNEGNYFLNLGDESISISQNATSTSSPIKSPSLSSSQGLVPYRSSM